MKRKTRTKPKRSLILKLLVLGVCVYMIVTITNLWKALNEAEKLLESEIEKSLALQNDIEELNLLLEDESNSQIIEKAARERLGYIKSDEQVFIDISGN